MDTTFYDRKGQPVVYTNDGVLIHRFSGEPVAYLHDDSVYSFGGRYIPYFASLFRNASLPPSNIGIISSLISISSSDPML